MNQRSKADREAPRGRPITARDVFEVCGEIDDTQVVAIVDLQPSYEELEEAAAWAAEEGDALRDSDRPLNGKVSAIYEILATELDQGGSE